MNALITAASADVAGHRIDDFGIRRVWLGREERRRLHDLTGLAVAALRHIQRAPGLLHRVIAVAVEPFDRHYRAAAEVTHGDGAGARRLAVEMHRAGAAQRDAAAELRSGEAELVAQV